MRQPREAAAMPTPPGSADDGLGDSTVGRPRPRWVLWSIAVAETITLTLLLVNIAAWDNSRGVARAVGPVHGTLYLLGVLLTWTAGYSRRMKLLAVVPLVGAYAAARASTPPA